MSYPQSQWERIMKIQDVFTKAYHKQLTWQADRRSYLLLKAPAPQAFSHHRSISGSASSAPFSPARFSTISGPTASGG